MRKPCRCLLSEDESQRPLYEIVRDYLDTMDADARVDTAVYMERLAVCRRCERLSGGTCALCGCYVEIRAAKRGMRCPDVPDRWEQ